MVTSKKKKTLQNSDEYNNKSVFVTETKLPATTTQSFLQTPLLGLLLTQYRSGDQIEKNKMGVACSTYWEEERCIQGFGGETLR